MSCCHSCSVGRPCEGSCHPHLDTGPSVFQPAYRAARAYALAQTPLTDCAPLPWYPAAIKAIAQRRWELDQTDLERLTSTVLRELYPVTLDGDPIDWEQLERYNPAPCLLELRRLVRAQLAFELAQLDLASSVKRYTSIGGVRR